MQVEIIIKLEDNTEVEQIYTNPKVIMIGGRGLSLIIDGIDGGFEVGEYVIDGDCGKKIISIQYRLEGRKDYKNIEIFSLD